MGSLSKELVGVVPSILPSKEDCWEERRRDINHQAPPLKVPLSNFFFRCLHSPSFLYLLVVALEELSSHMAGWVPCTSSRRGETMLFFGPRVLSHITLLMRPPPLSLCSTSFSLSSARPAKKRSLVGRRPLLDDALDNDNILRSTMYICTYVCSMLYWLESARLTFLRLLLTSFSCALHFCRPSFTPMC